MALSAITRGRTHREGSSTLHMLESTLPSNDLGRLVLELSPFYRRGKILKLKHREVQKRAQSHTACVKDGAGI